MARKPPAYPRPGSGEDFPARRPGVKVGETRSGAKRMQPTRASSARRAKAGVNARYEGPFYKAPLHTKGKVRGTPDYTWRGGRPSGRRLGTPFSAGVRGKPTRRNPWPL